MEKITAEQAFKAMYFFLDNYYEHIHLTYLGDMLSDLQLLKDGGTADPAAGIEWLECLEEAIQELLQKKK